MGYRSEIDGLRCLAVISVLLFHFGVPSIPGGFVGVDVFFVISGFLITSQVRADLEAGTFTLTRFYARRFRRILPVLLVVLTVTLLAGALFLVPWDYSSLGQSAASAAVGSSNFYFVSIADYFARSSETMPLLHTWSLAVEEQFYLVWPVALMILYRRPKSVVTVLVAVIVGSMLVCEVTLRSERQAVAFYMLHTRAWELAAGALLVFVPAITQSWVAETIETIGLGLILVAILVVNSDAQFPGLGALTPCVGAALIVAKKNHSSTVQRALSLPPFLFVGRLSYSLYLWHWPILVLFRHYNSGVGPSWGQGCLLVIASFVLSILTYWFVERPFRKMKEVRRTVVFWLLAALSVGLAGLSIPVLAGVPQRFPPAALKYLEYLYAPMGSRRSSTCFMSSAKTFPGDYNESVCSPEGRPSVLLVGDSQANHFADAIEQVFPEVTLSVVTASGCVPSSPPRGAARCTDTLSYALGDLLNRKRFDAIIISARWSEKLEGAFRLIGELHKRVPRLIIFGPTIEYTEALPILLAKSTLLGADILQRGNLYEAKAAIDERLRIKAVGPGVAYFSPLESICPTKAECKTTINDVPMAVDYGHLTPQGALWVIEKFRSDGLLGDLMAP